MVFDKRTTFMGLCLSGFITGVKKRQLLTEHVCDCLGAVLLNALQQVSVGSMTVLPDAVAAHLAACHL